MEEIPHKTKPQDRVRIKDDITHMYKDARVYNEGIVRARIHDEYGYPLIYVEWDKTHWAYSGEEDGWLIEAHFDLVEDQMAEEKKFDQLLNGLSDLVSSFRENDGDSSEYDNKLDGSDYAMAVPAGGAELTFEQVLAKAMAEAKDAEAFVVITAMPEEFAGKDLLIPRVYMHSRRDDAAIMLDATMADLAAQSHARLVLSVIEQAKRDGQTRS